MNKKTFKITDETGKEYNVEEAIKPSDTDTVKPVEPAKPADEANSSELSKEEIASLKQLAASAPALLELIASKNAKPVKPADEDEDEDDETNEDHVVDTAAKPKDSKPADSVAVVNTVVKVDDTAFVNDSDAKELEISNAWKNRFDKKGDK